MRVVFALVLGLVFGILFQVIFGAGTFSGPDASIRKWVNIVGQLALHARSPVDGCSLGTSFHCECRR
ncbi:MAG: hypothetical protein LBQ77_07515 [Treponema sp.]|nr:hypothetical protein [Treponema sp.]